MNSNLGIDTEEPCLGTVRSPRPYFELPISRMLIENLEALHLRIVANWYTDGMPIVYCTLTETWRTHDL